MDIDECLITEAPSICADWLVKTPVDLPEHMGIERYAEAEKAFADAIAPLNPDAQLFRYGFWHTPGISDIDMLCVVDDNIDTAAVKHIEMTPRGKLMVHPPLLLPKSIAGSFRWFLPITDIFPVGDANTGLAIETPVEQEFQDLCLISSFNASLSAWRALRLAQGKAEIPVRGGMLRVWTIRHTIQFAARAGLTVPAAWLAFADDCEAMRASFRQGNPVNMGKLSLALARGEIIARDVASKTALARLERSNAPYFVEQRLEVGRVRVQIESPGWQIRASSFGRKKRTKYISVTLPPHVAAFVGQIGGTNPFDNTLHKVRHLSTIRNAFVDRHRAYGLWSGKQFLGEDARPIIARIRDRMALHVISALR